MGVHHSLGSSSSASWLSLAERLRECNVSTVTKQTGPCVDTELERATHIAQGLSPQERHALVRAGSPRWLRLPVPWQPCSGPQEAVAVALASPTYSLLEPLPGYLGAYQLTHLGEVVAGVWLLH